ncbi:Hypothetical protein NTJ_04610 [Nesidiocoris tenuis]|uniref:Uncharacterized protein n=1 Tax=Nesidiocoris tenuis TaxID=355587 RepID=A0ABN7AKI1_9HEMI|nr:Hypothetical protein NTJ_04610 [Nesidiocoris tenuis]
MEWITPPITLTATATEGRLGLFLDSQRPRCLTQIPRALLCCYVSGARGPRLRPPLFLAVKVTLTFTFSTLCNLSQTVIQYKSHLYASGKR